jgi:IclR family transcriptional regulator, acetate operon repressor
MIVRPVAHVLELLEYFAQVNRPSSLAEITTAMGWPRSSTFNLLTTLAQRGFLCEPRPRGGYYPSPRWDSLVQKIAATKLIPEGLRDTAAEVARATGETTAIVAPAGSKAVFVYVVESSAAIRFSPQVGFQLPIEDTSSGRALLAQYPPRERTAVLRNVRFDKQTQRTMMNAEQVEAEIKRAATRGWHQNIGTFMPDLTGVALPVGLEDRYLSIVVAGPTIRMRQRIPKIAATLKGALRRHSSGLKTSEANKQQLGARSRKLAR